MNANVIEVAGDLRLRRLELGDAPAIFEAIDAERDDLGRWLPFVAATRRVEDSEAYVRSVLEPPGCETSQIFVIECEGAFAGLIGLRDTDWDNAKAAIGYWLSARFQKRGLVTRAARCLIGRAFDRLGLNRIELRCAVGNAPSHGVARRLGFTLEGIERDAERFDDGHFVDAEVFSLLRREWEARAVERSARMDGVDEV